MATKILKKITIGNPLYNLGMFDELERYEAIGTDEELADFYHRLLRIADENEKQGKPHSVLRNFTYIMIAFSTGGNVNERMLLS